MHFYLRLIPDRDSDSYSTEEQQQLRDCVSSAPGVETVKELKRLPRGGYSVTMEHDNEDVDSLISYLASHGYRPVI